MKKGKTLSEVLQDRKLEERINQSNYKKENFIINKKKLATLIIITIILVAFILVVINTEKVDKQAQSSCEQNHSADYCIEKLNF